MFAVEVYAAVRRFVHLEGNSQRDAARVFGLSRDTISKMCRFSIPPGYTRLKPVAKPKHRPRTARRHQPSRNSQADSEPAHAVSVSL